MSSADTVSQSTIKVTISSLEYHRLRSQHLYKDDPEAQISLRTDTRVHDLEQSTSHRELEREKKAQKVKQSGTSAGEKY